MKGIYKEDIKSITHEEIKINFNYICNKISKIQNFFSNHRLYVKLNNAGEFAISDKTLRITSNKRFVFQIDETDSNLLCQRTFPYGWQFMFS